MEIPEDEIAEVEHEAGDHSHEGVAADDGTLSVHLAEVHGLEPAVAVSPATQEGLHDRLHGSSKAADD